MNVIGSRPHGWGARRGGAGREMPTRPQDLASTSGDDTTLVLDGRPLTDLPEGDHGGVHVRYATRGGRNAADDRIVELVGADADPASITIRTPDPGLAQRLRGL